MADSNESRPNNLGNNSTYTITGGYFEEAPEFTFPPENACKMNANYGDVSIIHVSKNTVNREPDGIITRIDENGNILTGNKEKENIEK